MVNLAGSRQPLGLLTRTIIYRIVMAAMLTTCTAAQAQCRTRFRRILLGLKMIPNKCQSRPTVAPIMRFTLCDQSSRSSAAQYPDSPSAVASKPAMSQRGSDMLLSLRRPLTSAQLASPREPRPTAGCGAPPAVVFPLGAMGWGQ